MKIINDISLSPEENLAMDELLLLKAESGEGGETLRFWEQDEYFVVVGRSGKVGEECFMPVCLKDGVKVLRRSSGGGTVLQGKGCLNYSAVLAYSRNEKYRNIEFSYESIMNGISEEFIKSGIAAKFLPISDLAVGGRKFSGNAQARKKRYFLHHGTVLYGMELGKIARYIKHPPKEPEYRTSRAHNDFLTNIPFSAEDIKGVIQRALASGGSKWKVPGEYIKELAEIVGKKYSQNSWNFCF